jgi:hypothetical protein
MIVGSVTWLGFDSRRHGYYASLRQRLIAMAVGALAFTLGQTLQAHARVGRRDFHATLALLGRCLLGGFL